VRNLVLSVNPGISPTSNSKLKIRAIFAKDNGNRFYQLSLNRAKSWLFGKATKVCAVISKVNPVTTKPVDRQVNGFCHF
jgi:hypothetical protein